jgi:hypothetical protein
MQMANYPNYPSQPFTGSLPGMIAVGPPDLRYSSSTSPYYAARIDRQYGRRLAGSDTEEVQDEVADSSVAANELAYYQEMDDVQGSGIFDAPGTEPNIYPDAGVLADRHSVPGYLARERMFEESEVIDSTTGRPVIYVNGGAVAMDSAAQVAFIERKMYDAPRPVTDSYGVPMLPGVSTVNVAVARSSITPASVAGLGRYHARRSPMRGLGADVAPAPAGMSANTKALILTGTVAFAAGIAWAVFGGKGKRR